MNRLLSFCLLIAPAALASDVTGRFDSGTRYAPPALHAPAAVSRMYARSVPRLAGHVRVDLPATGDSSMIIVAPGHGARLTTPAGAALESHDRGSLDRGLRRFDLEGGSDEVLHVMHATAASYRVDLDLADGQPGATIVVAEPDSAMTLSTWAAPLSRQPGEPITLHAELRDGDLAVDGASLTASLTSPTGRTFDAIPLSALGNGVYAATLGDLPEHAAGPWQVRFDADGTTSAGVPFSRTGAGELVAERGAARLGKPRLEVAGDVVHVVVPVDVAIEGRYRLDVIASRAGISLAWAEGARTLTRGATTLSIDLPLSDVGNVDDLLADVRLLGLDEVGVAGRVTN